MASNSPSGTDLFLEVCQPLSGSPLARQLADLFTAAAEKGWLTAVGALAGSPSFPVLLAYAAVFGLATWVKSAKGREKARQMADAFRRLEDRTVRIDMILHSITDHGEVFARLSRLEQQDLAEITAAVTENRLLTSGRIRQEIVLAFRDAGITSVEDLENLRIYDADTNGRVRRIEQLVETQSDALLPATAEALQDAFIRYAQSPEIRRLRYVGLRLVKKEPPSLDIREVFVPLDVTVRQRRSTPHSSQSARLPTEDLMADAASAPFRQEDADSSTTAPFVDTFRANRALVVLGEPGAGKTTLLRWLAVVAAENTLGKDLGVPEELLPLPVSVGKLAELRAARLANHEDPCVLEVIADYFWRGNVGSRVGTHHHLYTFLREELAAKRCLVLLDGLDEVKADQRDAIRNWLETFASEFAGNRFVVSCRRFGFAGFSLADAVEVVVRPFSDRQVGAYVTAFCRAYFRWENNGQADDANGTKEAKALLAAIHANPRLSGLARNPFLLAVIALIHRAVGRLPRHRVQLYQLFAQCLCETWGTARRMVCEELQPQMQFEEEALPILGELACRMHEDHPTGRAPREYVLDVLADALQRKQGATAVESRKAAEKFLMRNAEEVQLFVERGPDEWGFLHLTFQEFFVAAGLHAEERFHEEATKRLFQPRWEEVLRLGVGHMAIVQQRRTAAANFVKAVLDYRSQEHPWLTDSLRLQVPLATLLAGEAGDSLPPVEQKRLGEQFADWCVLYSSTDFTRRILEELSLMDLREGVAIPLTQRLNSDLPSTRRSAAEALGLLKAESAAPALARALKDQQKAVRESAAQALGQIKAESTVPALLEALRDEEADVRQFTAAALGEIKTESAIPGLLQALDDKATLVRVIAAQALGRMKAESAVPALMGALRDKQTIVGLFAALALTDIDAESGTRRLMESLTDTVEQTRQVAAEALGRINAESAVPGLLKVLEDEAPAVRFAALNAIGYIRTRSAVPGLLKALKDKQMVIRTFAAQKLGQIKAESAVPGLLEALRDEEPAVCSFAAEALGQIKPESAVPTLLQALRDKENGRRQFAALALGKMKTESATPDLLKALTDQEAVVRSFAAYALGQIKAEAAVPALLESLTDNEKEVRRYAAAALGQIKTESAIPGLLEVLTDMDNEVRQSAVHALGQINAASAVPWLLEALRDQVALVRLHAAQALGQIKAESAAPALLEALKDDDAAVRKAAFSALLTCASTCLV